jgi:hypothetical protein
MFTLFNYIQIKCEDCKEYSSFNPGKKYESIECPICKEKKEKENAKQTRKRSRKSTKEV